MPMRYAIVTTLACLMGMAETGGAQIVRSDFRAGDSAPAAWKLSGGAGRWDKASGVSVTGNGDDSNYWSRTVPQLKPGATYRVRFNARIAPGSSTNTVISGLDVCNRDFAATSEWQPYSFVFTTPRDVSNAYLRLGQWHLKGTVAFADFRLTPVVPVHLGQGPSRLGEGEQIEQHTYSFTAPLAGEGSNSSRTLASHTAGFNSNRWVFGGDSEVVYRHQLAGVHQTSARVTVSLGYYTGGECVVSASRDGTNWVEAARIPGLGSRTVELPASLFPADAVWVRLKGGPGSFQVDGYSYRAELDRTILPATGGSTHYLEVTKQDPRLAVDVETIGNPGDAQPQSVEFRLKPQNGFKGHAVATLTCRQKNMVSEARRDDIPLVGGRDARVSLVHQLRQTGPYRMELAIATKGGAPLFRAEAEGVIPQYNSWDYGYALPGEAGGFLWWCESAYKVSPSRPAIGVLSDAIRISAAGRERRHVQLILRSFGETSPIQVSVTDLRGPGGARIAKSAVQLREEAYVRVRVPTDKIGVAAEWPDPLPPLKGAWKPEPGRNNPLWITIAVPPGAKPGDYTGRILLQAARWKRTVTLRLHVWGFSLPERTALRSGFGINPDNIRRYHNIRSDAAMEKVWDLYMRDFAAHRLGVYNPMALAGINVSEVGGRHVAMDFTAFDRAGRRYLDEMGFNSFTVGVLGMGTGRYPNYDQGSFLGHPAGTPEYDALMSDYGRQLEDHLAQKGWLKKAYVYWYDEPETTDYPFVVKGMERLKRYFPRLKRMLTEEFQDPLYGSVDLWCPITPNYRAEPAHARQAKGEEVWWYVCTGPKEPFCALFIDHPAIEMRMWLWQTWKYRVQGILIWETTWWTSPSQFKETVQNPWEDPMSYTSEASGVWGNGDGRFFYPPVRKAGDTREYVTAPIDSIRWEMLGEGVQDWEYFHMLDGLVQREEMRGNHSAAVTRAKSLLAIPESICRDMTHFTTDPRVLDAYRARLARAIEVLERGSQ